MYWLRLNRCMPLEPLMPLTPREIDALEDMIRFGSDAVTYVRGFDFDTFVADHKTHHAIM